MIIAINKKFSAILFLILFLNIFIVFSSNAQFEPLEVTKTPRWVLKLFKSIDSLNVSKQSGFDCFDNNVVMRFGSKSVFGLKNVKKFFLHIDSPYKTHHTVIKVWRNGNIILLQLHAVLVKKGEKKTDAIKINVFNVFWMNRNDKVIQYNVILPPKTNKDLFDRITNNTL